MAPGSLSGRCGPDSDTAVFPRNERSDVDSAPFRESVDSCTMLNDLDFLATPEWQTMPQAVPSAMELKLREEAETATQEKAYAVALKVALNRVEGLNLDEVQARDKRFMAHKLEFTK